MLYGASGADTLLGGADDDAAYCWSDSDSVEGGQGDDFLDGSPCNDTLKGGAGDDTFRVTDTAGVKARETIFAGTGTDTLELSGVADDCVVVSLERWVTIAHENPSTHDFADPYIYTQELHYLNQYQVSNDDTYIDAVDLEQVTLRDWTCLLGSKSGGGPFQRGKINVSGKSPVLTCVTPHISIRIQPAYHARMALRHSAPDLPGHAKTRLLI